MTNAQQLLIVGLALLAGTAPLGAAQALTDDARYFYRYHQYRPATAATPAAQTAASNQSTPDQFQPNFARQEPSVPPVQGGLERKTAPQLEVTSQPQSILPDKTTAKP